MHKGSAESRETRRSWRSEVRCAHKFSVRLENLYFRDVPIFPDITTNSPIFPYMYIRIGGGGGVGVTDIFILFLYSERIPERERSRQGSSVRAHSR